MQTVDNSQNEDVQYNVPNNESNEDMYELWQARRRDHQLGDVSDHRLVAIIPKEQALRACSARPDTNILAVAPIYYYRLRESPSYCIYVVYKGEDHLYEVAYNPETAEQIAQKYRDRHIKHATGCTVVVKPVDESSARAHAIVGEGLMQYIDIYNEEGNIQWSDDEGGEENNDQCNCPRCRLPELVDSEEGSEEGNREGSEEGNRESNREGNRESNRESNREGNRENNRQPEWQRVNPVDKFVNIMLNHPMIDAMAQEYVAAMYSGQLDSFVRSVGIPPEVIHLLIIRYLVRKL